MKCFKCGSILREMCTNNSDINCLPAYIDIKSCHLGPCEKCMELHVELSREMLKIEELKLGLTTSE